MNTGHAHGGLADHLIEQHEHGGQDEDDQQHAHHGAPGDQHAHGADDLNIGIQRHAEGCGKHAHAGDDDGRNGGRQKGPDRTHRSNR